MSASQLTEPGSDPTQTGPIPPGPGLAATPPLPDLPLPAFSGALPTQAAPAPVFAPQPPLSDGGLTDAIVDDRPRPGEKGSLDDASVTRHLNANQPGSAPRTPAPTPSTSTNVCYLVELMQPDGSAPTWSRMIYGRQSADVLKRKIWDQAIADQVAGTFRVTTKVGKAGKVDDYANHSIDFVELTRDPALPAQHQAGAWGQPMHPQHQPAFGFGPAAVGYPPGGPQHSGYVPGGAPPPFGRFGPEEEDDPDGDDQMKMMLQMAQQLGRVEAQLTSGGGGGNSFHLSQLPSVLNALGPLGTSIVGGIGTLIGKFSETHAAGVAAGREANATGFADIAASLIVMIPQTLGMIWAMKNGDTKAVTEMASTMADQQQLDGQDQQSLPDDDPLLPIVTEITRALARVSKSAEPDTAVTKEMEPLKWARAIAYNLDARVPDIVASKRPEELAKMIDDRVERVIGTKLTAYLPEGEVLGWCDSVKSEVSRLRTAMAEATA